MNVEQTIPPMPPDPAERQLMVRASDLFEQGQYRQAVTRAWSAVLRNLKRRIEALDVELFLFVTRGVEGRRDYDASGPSLAERWRHVDEDVILEGARALNLL